MPRQTNKQNNFLLSGDGEDGLVVVSKYIQTRQRWLRAKMIKTSHGRHYIKGPCFAQQRGDQDPGNSNLQEEITIRKQKTPRKEDENEKEKKIRNNNRKQRDRMAGMHPQVDPLSPSTNPTLYQRQRILLGTSHSASLKVINFYDRIFLERLFTLRSVGKSSFVSHTKHTAEATNTNLLHS